MIRGLRRFLGDERGTTIIETAVVAPVLALLALGSYDVSRMVARQHELQNGAGDMESIVLASSQGQATDVQTIKTVLLTQLNVPADKLTVVKKYRCGTVATLQNDDTTCAVGVTVATYVQVTVNDTYTPMWTTFGVGSPIAYKVVRMVQVSSAAKA